MNHLEANSISRLMSQCQADNDRFEKLKSAYDEKLRQYKDENKKKINDLTEEEEFVIAHYIGSGYSWVNEDLRNGIQFPTKCRHMFSTLLDISLEKIESFSGTTFRMDDPSGEVGVILNWFESNKGKIISIPYYLSTSKVKWDNDNKPLIWEIQTLKVNSYAKDVSMINEIEEEVLFKRNSKFEIKEVNFKLKTVKLDEVNPNKSADLKLVKQYFNQSSK